MHVAPASEMTYTVSGGALKKLYSIQSNPDLLIPELTDASTSRYLLYVSGTLSLAWYSRQNSQQDLSPVSSEAISQVVWNPVLSVHCMQQLEWRHVLFTSGKGRTQVVSVQWTTSCRNYSRTGCFKNCKNITTVGRVMLWLLFSVTQCISLQISTLLCYTQASALVLGIGVARGQYYWILRLLNGYRLTDYR